MRIHSMDVLLPCFIFCRNDLSTLSYLNVPINIVSSRLADSLTLAVGPWLGLPCLPSLVTFAKSTNVI